MTSILQRVESLPDDKRPPDIGRWELGIAAVVRVLLAQVLKGLAEACFDVVIVDLEAVAAGNVCILFVRSCNGPEESVLDYISVRICMYSLKRKESMEPVSGPFRC